MAAEKSARREEDQREQLLRQLHSLLAAWKEILAGVDLNVRASVRELISALEGGAGAAGPEQLSAMLAELQSLNVKPRKGRVKDVGRVVRLLESLSALLPANAERS